MQPSSAKILVVDDDQDLCTMLSRFLGKHGYEVLTAPNPIQAREVLAREPVALIITDLMMPHQDGIQFVQQLHAEPSLKNLPIILMTAYPSDEIYELGLRKGVAMTLSKPLELNKLLSLVGFATS